MTKVPSTGCALRGLLFEIKILAQLERHPHIVGLVGAYTDELRKGKVFVFLEFCELGSLQHYLRKCKPANQQNNECETAETTIDQFDSETEKVELTASLLRDISRWSSEIANGMQFIASKHIVHLDLATRNILLTADKRAKITDFGLSRRMYDYQSYIKKHQQPLPWRFMAPESLRRSEFTEKSDVWSFGVLLWEIYSLGDEPFPGLSWDVNFSTKLERGLKPGEPIYNTNNMYSIMLRCWTINPRRRPTFSELVNVLNPGTLEADYLSASNLKSTEPAPNTNASIYESVTITRQGIRNACVDNSRIPVVRSNPTKEKKIRSTVARILSSFSLALLLMILLIILWSIWGTGPSFITSSTTSKDNDFQGEPNPDEITRSPLEVEIEQAIYNNTNTSRALGYQLFIAIRGNLTKEEEVKNLVQLGADVNVMDNLFRTPLIVAANCSNDKSVCLRIIQFLIDNGADVTKKDREGHTFLHHLVVDGLLTPPQYHQIVTYLISKNMSYLFITKRYIPYLTALENIEVENHTLMLLYNSGVYFSSTSPRQVGYHVLSYAVRGKRSLQLLSWIVKLLELRNQSVLHYAAWACRPDAVKHHSENGLDVNLQDSLGFTPLHEVIDEGYGNVLETVQVLLENGADISIKSLDGRTPLTTALQRKDFPGMDKVIELLSNPMMRPACSRKIQECGKRLRDTMYKECNMVYSKPHTKTMESLLMEQVGKRATSTGRTIIRRVRRSLVDNCCYKSCCVEDFRLKYCGNHVPIPEPVPVLMKLFNVIDKEEDVASSQPRIQISISSGEDESNDGEFESHEDGSNSSQSSENISGTEDGYEGKYERNISLSAKEEIIKESNAVIFNHTSGMGRFYKPYFFEGL